MEGGGSAAALLCYLPLVTVIEEDDDRWPQLGESSFRDPQGPAAADPADRHSLVQKNSGREIPKTIAELEAPARETPGVRRRLFRKGRGHE